MYVGASDYLKMTSKVGIPNPRATDWYRPMAC